MARRLVSSMAVRARRLNSGSVSSSSRAAPAWRVATVRAWPTESCSSRASRLRSASRTAWASSAAIRSAWAGPSSTGAIEAASAPRPATA